MAEDDDLFQDRMMRKLRRRKAKQSIYDDYSPYNIYYNN